MKMILLSAGDDLSVYSVPNDVADNLAEYCVQFGKWVAHSPDAERFRIKRGDFVDLDYTEQDFIDYLNNCVCGTRSVFLTVIDNVQVREDAPKRFLKLPCYYF